MKDSEFKKTVLDEAIKYINIGWHVFPVHSIDMNGKCTCGDAICSGVGKHPRIARGLKGASNDLAQINKWFGIEAPLSNIGVVTGEISNLTVIDIDIGEGKFGAESWAEAISGHGEPQTLIAQTGSGGMHVFFKYNSALKTATNVLGSGIDCRNDGGYIVAAPSLHRSGGAYSWLNWEKPLVNLPAHLIQKKFSRESKSSKTFHNFRYTLEQVNEMLKLVPSDDRDYWRSVGIILGREFDRSDEAWQVYFEWSDKFKGKKSKNHEKVMKEAFYYLSQQSNENELTLKTILKLAKANGWTPQKGSVPITNFVYCAKGNNFIYRPATEYWLAAAVNSMVSPVNENGLLIQPDKWIKDNQGVTTITCEPKFEDDYVKGYDCINGEIIEVEGGAIFNTYRRPKIILGDSKLVTPFLDHVHKIFHKEGDAEQFLNFMAHRVQKTWEKPRFALLISGDQGVGKDTAIEMCIPSIGNWNVANIEPSALESPFNEFASKTLIRISEASNLGDMSRWIFNERIKVLIAGLPDTCLINPKYGQKYSMRMHCGVIITTNHLTSGIYIPSDDRRYDVIESATLDQMNLQNSEIKNNYFSSLWEWFQNGGSNNIAAYLKEKDISKFSANNGQRKTKAHQSVIKMGLQQNSWFYDILEQEDNPTFISCPMIRNLASKNEGHEFVNHGSFMSKLRAAIKNAKYFNYDNPEAKDGRWYQSGIKKGFVVYASNGTREGLDPRPHLKYDDEYF